MKPCLHHAAISTITGRLVECGRILFLPVQVQRTCPLPRHQRRIFLLCKETGLECKSGQGCLWKLAFPPLLLSALSSSHFHCALQKSVCLFWARPDEQRDVHTTSLCVFLRWSGRSYHAYYQKLPRIIYLPLEILPCRFIPLHFPKSLSTSKKTCEMSQTLVCNLMSCL